MTGTCAEASWQLAAETHPELDEVARFKAAAYLGMITVRGEVDYEPSADTTENHATLMAAAQLAALGDEMSRGVVRRNAATDVAERLYKAKHETRVQFQVKDGYMMQDDRRVTDIHRNALEHLPLNPEMLRRTKLELRSIFMFQELHAAGVFSTHDAVVFSPSSTTMSLADKKRYNFFLDTETCSIQYLTATTDGFELQTAFVAGKASPDAERHDIATIQKLAAQQKLRLPTQDGTEMLQYIWLVPKHSTPNGVTDIVRQYDDAAGGTFYGLAEPRQDYAEYAETCKRRNFDGIVDKITQQLVAESHLFSSPIDAIKRLDYLSERLGVRYAAQDRSINPLVFGATAARHLEDARFFIEQGDDARYEMAIRSAQRTAKSGSCPIDLGKLLEDLDGPQDGSEGAGVATDEAKSKKKMMSCPHCGAQVFDDPCARVLSCWDCTALVVNGVEKSKGNGGSRKRDAERKAREAALAQKMEKRAEVMTSPTAAANLATKNKPRRLPYTQRPV